MLVVFPINNNENRIQPFLKLVRENFRYEDFIFMFIQENLAQSASSILKLEKDQNPHDKFEHIRVAQNINRGESLYKALEFAKKNNLSYIMQVNDGWEDNIYEFANILNNKEYLEYDLICANRTPTKKNLGFYIHLASSFLFSLLKGEKVPDSKGDSINIIKVDLLKTIALPSYSSHNYFFEILTSSKKTKFSIINNGVNFRSNIKLNSVYFLRSISFFFRYILK